MAVTEALSAIHRRAHMARTTNVTEDKTDKRPVVRFKLPSLDFMAHAADCHVCMLAWIDKDEAAAK